MGALPEDQITLEDWLDGELSEAACNELRARLSQDPALAAELTRLQAERQIRSGFWSCCEPSADQIDTLASAVRRDCLKHHLFQERMHRFRNGLAVAATFAVVFASGWMGRGRMIQQPNPTEEAGMGVPTAMPAMYPHAPVSAADYAMTPVSTWRNGPDYPIDAHGLSTQRPTYKLVLLDPMGTALDSQDIEDIRDPRKIAKPFADLQTRMENAQRPDTTVVNQIVPLDRRN